MELEKPFRRAGDVKKQARIPQDQTQCDKAPQGQTLQDLTS